MAIYPELPSDQYEVIGQAPDREGVLHPQYEVKYTALEHKKMKWFVCGLCGLSYPIDRGILIKGKRYCTVLECAREKMTEI